MNEPMQDAEERSDLREFTEDQRRVLGVLVEKGLTTPEYYPLTLKALTTGCNQKSNRDPVVSFSEDDSEDSCEELRSLGFVAQVHTDGGRAPRYRHLIRKRFDLTERQLAILAELWLRGRQQLGELRSRASRMAAIDSLDELRTELQGLIDQQMVRASGDLKRRGIEVDHDFYPGSEKKPILPPQDDDGPAVPNSIGHAESEARREIAQQASSSDPESRSRLDQLEQTVAALSDKIESLEEEVERLRAEWTGA